MRIWQTKKFYYKFTNREYTLSPGPHECKSKFRTLRPQSAETCTGCTGHVCKVCLHLNWAYRQRRRWQKAPAFQHIRTIDFRLSFRAFQLPSLRLQLKLDCGHGTSPNASANANTTKWQRNCKRSSPGNGGKGKHGQATILCMLFRDKRKSVPDNKTQRWQNAKNKNKWMHSMHLFMPLPEYGNSNCYKFQMHFRCV